MSKSTFESLPNEILLMRFSYLSSFDLCQTFLYIINSRIQYLLTSIHHSFNVHFMHYDQLHLWLNNNPNDRNRFSHLIDTIVFHNSFACRTLLEYWENSFNESEQSNVLFSSIKGIIVFQPESFPYILVRPILIP